MSASLTGVRIWLSGSVPDDSTPEETQRIRKFVEAFAEAIFREGGTLVHGSHPSIRESLLAAAEAFKRTTEAKAPLRLVCSRYFSDTPEKNGIDLARWRDLCGDGVEQSPTVAASEDLSEDDRKARSLAIMRQIIVARCNAIVATGGKWWEVARERSGVAAELRLARDSNLPLFLIGGMGGTVAGLLKAEPELFRDCANGLRMDENERLAGEKDPVKAADRIVRQLLTLPLRRLTPGDRSPFRILCLDGGGIRGAYTAAVLYYWERYLKLHQGERLRLVDHFDLIAGTSTGGILATGLGLGLSAETMTSFYVNNGKKIFGSGEGLDAWWHSFRHWFTAKFEQGPLTAELETAYGKSPVAQGRARNEWMDNSICRLLIPAYNTTIDRPHLFRTPHGRFKYSDRGNDAVLVALASAAAPTYFNPVQSKGAVAAFEAVDGGVWANSPVTVAIAEATGELGIPLERIHVLSIGTTHTDKLVGQPMQLDGTPLGMIVEKLLPWPSGSICSAMIRKTWQPVPIPGVAGWVANIASLLMKSQAQASDIVARHLLGDRYVRIDSSTQYGELDDINRVSHFAGLGEDAAKEAATLATVQALFLDGVAANSWN